MKGSRFLTEALGIATHHRILHTAFDAFLSTTLAEHIRPGETWVGSCALDLPTASSGSKGAALGAILSAPFMSKHFGVLSNERIFIVEVPAPLGHPQATLRSMNAIELTEVTGVVLLGANLYFIYADGFEGHFTLDGGLSRTIGSKTREMVSGREAFISELTKRFSQTPQAIALRARLKRNARIVAVAVLVMMMMACAYAYATW